MFDLVHKHKRIVQFVLLLTALPFALWGVYSYDSSRGTATNVATVGRDKITTAEFDDTLNDQRDRMRQQLGPNFDAAAFDTPEVRYSVLEALIAEHLMRQQAHTQNIRVSDEQLQRFIQEVPAFQENGVFSQKLYEGFLYSQKKSAGQFEQWLRSQLQMQPLQEAYLASGMVSHWSAQNFLQLADQKREVSVATIAAEPYVAQAKIDDATLKAYYDANPKMFQVPEQVKIDYVELSRDAIVSSQSVSNEEVKKFYDTNIGPKFAEKSKARKQAEDILAQLKKDPSRFADLAKQYSQDPGSAKNGGDLDYFPRGMMVKSFDDAAFQLKVNQISDVVESDFGFHIIKLTGIKPADSRGKGEERRASHILIAAPKDAKDFDSARPEIELALKQQKAGSKFAETAENFQNLVYEQADGLDGVAKSLNLTVQHSAWLTRAQAQQVGHNNPKFAEAVFSPDAVQSKRNSEAIEVTPNVLMAARVVDHKAAAPKPFADVKGEIERQLRQTAGTKAAVQAGKEKLAALQQGTPVKLDWGKPQLVGRQQSSPEFGEDALQQIFRLNATKLPAYAGSVNEHGGYNLYRVSRVENPETNDAGKLKAISTRMSDYSGKEALTSYVAALKQKADIKIQQENLAKK